MKLAASRLQPLQFDSTATTDERLVAVKVPRVLGPDQDCAGQKRAGGRDLGQIGSLKAPRRQIAGFELRLIEFREAKVRGGKGRARKSAPLKSRCEYPVRGNRRRVIVLPGFSTWLDPSGFFASCKADSRYFSMFS